MRNCNLYHIVLLLLLSLPGYGQRTVVVHDQLEEYHLTAEDVHVFRDQTGVQTLEAVLQQQGETFLPVTSLEDFPPGVYWFRFIMQDTGTRHSKWLLQLPLHADHVIAHIPEGCGSRYRQINTGQQQPFDTREYRVRSVVFDVFPRSDCLRPVYVKMTLRQPAEVSLLLSNQKKYTEVLVDGYVFLGVIYGFLFLMALYNLILFFSTRERIYMYYIFYVLCSALFLTWKDGLGFQYVWPDTPAFNRYHFTGSFFLLFITFFLYARKFLVLRKFSKRLDNLVLVFGGLSVIQFLYSLFYPERFDPFPVTYMLTFLLFFAISVYQLFRGHQQVRYFLAGFGCILVALFVLYFRYRGMLSWSWFSEYVLNYGMVIEVIAMSLAIGDRLNIMRKKKMEIQKEIILHLKEKEELGDKINRELENKVTARTLELNDKIREIDTANSQLEHLVEELKSRNVQLDLDNWKLRKNVRKELENRISDKMLPYKKFLEVFPDEASCLRYLERLKWGEEGEKYRCRKCGNKKFLMGNQPFSKKCSKCNYIETVKAYTLFHRLHFPVQKAFYITYVTTRNQKITLNQLSEELGLRKNTCWAFRKKVLEKKGILHPGDDNPVFLEWENLMLRNI